VVKGEKHSFIPPCALLPKRRRSLGELRGEVAIGERGTKRLLLSFLSSVVKVVVKGRGSGGLKP